MAKHTCTSRQTTSFCAIVAALIISLGFVAQAQGSASRPFNKIWTVALSQYNGSDETGNSLTQLLNGTIVVGGSDANQPNYCPPNYGGVWLVTSHTQWWQRHVAAAVFNLRQRCAVDR